jgi:uncharacterized protein
MKIIVFSDSHSDVDTMCEAVDAMDPDMIIHLGDRVSDAFRLREIYSGIPMEYVGGNIDMAEGVPSEKVITIGNATLFICHGEDYDAEEGIDQIIEEGINNCADIVLFGHTHKHYLDIKDGMRIMNPGRIGRRSHRHIDASFGVIELGDNEMECSIVEYDTL